MASTPYILISAVRNEEQYIIQTIRSVIAQTIRPVKWIIVSDNSSDATLTIASSFTIEHPFIQAVPHSTRREHDFSSKVFALRQAIELLSKTNYDFIGVLDGDITLAENYYELLIRRFAENPKLGLAGGMLYDVCGGKEIDRKSSSWSVAGGIQFFKKQCFQDLGGFVPSKYGGEDTILEVFARMHSWEVRSFREPKALHWKPTGSAQGWQPVYAFNQGRRDYACGIILIFEVFKSLVRINQKPYILNGLLRTLGFLWSTAVRDKRMLTRSYIYYYRKEQMSRLFTLINPFRFWQKASDH